jgi:hypothetical protein
MVGPTAQLIALACHFNARARRLQAPAFSSTTTCKFCEFVHFLRQRQRWFGLPPKWAVVAHSPDEWIEQESRPGHRALLVYSRSKDPVLADHTSAAFAGGGGTWRLCVSSDEHMDVWEPRWEVGDRQAPEQRIWQVTYVEIAHGVKMKPPVLRTPAALVAALRVTLAEIIAFCERHQLDRYKETFTAAVDCFEATDASVLGYPGDLGPVELFDLPALQLLSVSQAAWVFGGMGSWNDMGFEGQEHDRYEKVSSDLHALLNEAIAVSVNSTGHAL